MQREKTKHSVSTGTGTGTPRRVPAALNSHSNGQKLVAYNLVAEIASGFWRLLSRSRL